MGASVFDGRANPPTLYINSSASSPVNLGTTKPRELFTDALSALAILLRKPGPYWVANPDAKESALRAAAAFFTGVASLVD